MSAAVNELLAAVTARLEADVALVGLIGTGRICDRRLPRGREPYVMLGEVECEDMSSDDDGLIVCHLTLTAWAAEGRRQVEAIAARIRAVLDDAALVLPTAVAVSLLHEKTASRREEKSALYRADIQFRSLLA
ncbi:DUF3168 domain-containing protein [Allorhizobium undicola]|uniref:DUF3168 domain-containing protein n=1 Tax=Allorhizobium undicola TaxID=78527 RepID=UPI000484A9DB|nr:DUF3168 domain-containing protein [Allorhizobium undicola]